eukprot:TRINITY_DN63387_c0_g2_i1.p1 TRINITY_DN63387_c0_g2~~TRINITY_DN63387_c0_g2_i1.p1  ORF type:complete len:720 (+),score=85.31 TRINITY_DN63387_c0_g2_i1:99-2258(+)
METNNNTSSISPAALLLLSCKLVKWKNDTLKHVEQRKIRIENFGVPESDPGTPTKVERTLAATSPSAASTTSTGTVATTSPPSLQDAIKTPSSKPTEDVPPRESAQLKQRLKQWWQALPKHPDIKDAITEKTYLELNEVMFHHMGITANHEGDAKSILLEEWVRYTAGKGYMTEKIFGEALLDFLEMWVDDEVVDKYLTLVDDLFANVVLMLYPGDAGLTFDTITGRLMSSMTSSPPSTPMKSTPDKGSPPDISVIGCAASVGASTPNKSPSRSSHGNRSETGSPTSLEGPMNAALAGSSPHFLPSSLSAFHSTTSAAANALASIKQTMEVNAANRKQAPPKKKGVYRILHNVKQQALSIRQTALDPEMGIIELSDDGQMMVSRSPSPDGSYRVAGRTPKKAPRPMTGGSKDPLRRPPSGGAQPRRRASAAYKPHSQLLHTNTMAPGSLPTSRSLMYTMSVTNEDDDEDVNVRTEYVLDTSTYNWDDAVWNNPTEVLEQLQSQICSQDEKIKSTQYSGAPVASIYGRRAPKSLTQTTTSSIGGLVQTTSFQVQHVGQKPIGEYVHTVNLNPHQMTPLHSNTNHNEGLLASNFGSPVQRRGRRKKLSTSQMNAEIRKLSKNVSKLESNTRQHIGVELWRRNVSADASPPVVPIPKERKERQKKTHYHKPTAEQKPTLSQWEVMEEQPDIHRPTLFSRTSSVTSGSSLLSPLTGTAFGSRV